MNTSTLLLVCYDLFVFYNLKAFYYLKIFFQKKAKCSRIECRYFNAILIGFIHLNDNLIKFY